MCDKCFLIKLIFTIAFYKYNIMNLKYKDGHLSFKIEQGIEGHENL